MKTMTTFQIILTVSFGVVAVLGVFFFSIARFNTGADAPGNTQGGVVIWGTIDESVVRGVITRLQETYKGFDVTYVQKRDEVFDQDLVESIANGVGPDAVFLSHDLIERHKQKITQIPFESLSVRTFRDTFVEEAELYLTNTGMIGFPFLIDPMVMYWNRSIFANAGLARPPREWVEFHDLARTLTMKDAAGNITRATAPLGGFSNITHAKSLVTLLIMQAGNPIIEYNNETGNRRVVLTANDNNGSTPVISALDFYTEFSNPSAASYTWNRSLPNSQDLFVSGDLALYFGFGSELQEIRKKNPNLNFDIVMMPQIQGETTRMTFGKMQAITVLKSAKNPQGAFVAMRELTGTIATQYLIEHSNYAPVRRDLVNNVNPRNPYKSVLYTSGLIARGWLDPNPDKSNLIFRMMIENITSGLQSPESAVSRANNELNLLVK